MRAPLTTAAISALLHLLLPHTTPAQIRKPKPLQATQSTATTELPITRVALYKNGVGFFEHDGHVTGTQSVTIDFTSAQLNDVLQSLTAVDLQGGRITGAGYNSTTPLDQQLKTLPLDLNATSTDVDFYNAIRGARVQVTGPGGAITGRLLSIDLRATSHTKPDDSNADTADRRYLTIVAESGAVKTLEITPTTTVILLDNALHTDVTRYLQLLAANRSQGLRHLTLQDRGTGTRDLRVSYISEVPIWKSTYRILFTDKPENVPASTQPRPDAQGRITASASFSDYDKGGPTAQATLQGWSVIDNTTGTDWLNVHLDLIAGAPQSFIQPLSTPYYTRRPEIPLPQKAQLEPQTHDSGEVTQVVGMAGISGSAAGGVLGGVAGVGASQTVEVNASAVAMPLMKARNRTSYAVPAPPPPPAYEELAQSSLSPQTTTASFDDFFEYSLNDPITIRKNESALVPILQTKLPIERVTLWSQQQPQALRTLWLTNASNLTLDRGSFSIVENGNFGGEGLLDPIHPGEKRLLSYAADQAVRVTPSRTNNSRRVQRLSISKGVLTETTLDVTEVTYDIHNAAPEPRTVIVEHPVPAGYTLDSNPKPEESVPSQNGSTTDRFRVVVGPAATEHLHMGERRTDHEFIRLIDRTEDQLVLLLRNAKVSPAALAQLQPVFDAHHTVVALDEQIRERQADIATITQDQVRLRDNLKVLNGSAEEKALASRYTAELNTQEDRLAALKQQIATLQTQRQAANQDFDNKLNSVNFDESL